MPHDRPVRGLLLLVTLLTLAGCGGGTPAESSSTEQEGRGAAAIREVSSLEGSQATAAEKQFVDGLAATMTRPHWDSGPEVMVLGYKVCTSGTPSAFVFDLVDDGWSDTDADAFVKAAEKHLC